MTSNYNDPRGRFAKGNPGRPQGAKNKAGRSTLAQIREMGPVAIEKLSEAVSAGERWAVECVIDRILPKDRGVEFEAATPADILLALQNGDISPAEAAAIATAMTNLSELDASMPQPRTINSSDYRILTTDTDDMAAEKYRRLLEDMK